MTRRRLKPWTTIASEVVHSNKWFKVIRDEFVTPVMKVGSYFTVHTNGTNKSVLLVVVEEGKVFFVKQYRYPSKKFMLEVPGGGVEKGSTILKAAKKELQEELGIKARKVLKIGSFLPWGSRTPEICSVVLATDLLHVEQKLEETERGLEIIKIEIKKVFQMMDQGRIADGVTLAALSIARNKLLRLVPDKSSIKIA